MFTTWIVPTLIICSIILGIASFVISQIAFWKWDDMKIGIFFTGLTFVLIFMVVKTLEKFYGF